MPRRVRPTKLELNNATDALRRAGESIEGYQQAVRRLTDARAQVLQILGEPNGKSSREAARRVMLQRDVAQTNLKAIREELSRAGEDYTKVPTWVGVKALVNVVIFYRELITQVVGKIDIVGKVVDK